VSKNVEAHNWKNTNCKRNNQSFESGEADNFEFVILLLMGLITNNLKIYYIPKGMMLWISHDHHFKWWFEVAPVRGNYSPA